MPASWRPNWSGCSTTRAGRGSSASGPWSRPGASLGGDGRQGPGRADPIARPASRRSTRAQSVDAPRGAGSPSSRPCPRCASGVSDYSARLLDELKRRYTIDLYHDAGYVPHIGLRSPDFGCYDYRLFERNARVLGYHALVYQMGNSPYHGYMYETLLRHPGIVTLHDLGLANFHFWYAQQPGVDGNAHIRREFEAYFGAGADEALRSLAAYADAPGGIRGACIQQGYHLNGRIFEQATAVIVHSPWCVEQVRKPVPGPSRQDRPWSRSGPPPWILPRSSAGRSAPASRCRQEALIIASLGLIQPPKMNVETIAAFAPLARAIPEALLIFVGP